MQSKVRYKPLSGDTRDESAVANVLAMLSETPGLTLSPLSENGICFYLTIVVHVEAAQVGEREGTELNAELDGAAPIPKIPTEP